MNRKGKRAIGDYWEKPHRLKTWSGFPVKEFYGPGDVEDMRYPRDIGNPGQYPYTRGIYKNMYRGRYWTKRQATGHASPSETSKQMKVLLDQGGTGTNLFSDTPSHLAIDSDHPMAQEVAGITGVPLCTIEDMEAAVEGIPLDKVSMSLLCGSISAPVVLAQYVGVVEKRGYRLANLRGTSSNDSVNCYICNSKESNPLDLGVKLWVDVAEYCAKNIPLWHAAYIGVPYNLREQGLDAVQEVAFGLAVTISYLESALRRGINIDDIACRLSFYCSAGIDFFEEIAKLRAMRRMYGRIMKKRLGAKDPKSRQFRFAVQCAGHSLVPQQAINNISRTAYEALVAVLAGAQSIFCTTYDEPVCLPTEEAQRVAHGVQHILAYETGVALTADPLGGSYYVEYLTNKIEEEATRIIEQIDQRGGFIEATRSGWVESEVDKGAMKYEEEVENGERMIVGVNTFVIPPEEDIPLPGGVLRVPTEASREQVERLKAFKARRDMNRLREAIMRLRGSAENERGNLMPSIIEAVKLGATLGEVMGTLRQAYGLSWDPYNMVQSPF